MQYVYDAISIKETQNIAYDVLAPGGHIVLVLPGDIDAVKLTEDKTIIQAFGLAWPEDAREVGVSFFKALPKLLEEGDIKVCDTAHLITVEVA